MVSLSLTKTALIDRLLDVFRTNGFEGTSMAHISAATGLGKSSLYHHFPGGKEEMAEAVFDRAGAWLKEEIVGALASGTRAHRIDGMLKALNGFYEGGTKPCIIASMSIGDACGRHRELLKEAIETWTNALARALVETGARPQRARDAALDAVVRIQGALVVSAALGDGAVFKRMLRALRADLTATTAGA